MSEKKKTPEHERMKALISRLTRTVQANLLGAISGTTVALQSPPHFLRGKAAHFASLCTEYSQVQEFTKNTALTCILSAIL